MMIDQPRLDSNAPPKNTVKKVNELFFCDLVFFQYLLGNQEDNKRHNNEIDQVGKEPSPGDNDWSDGDRSSLPLAAGNEKRNDWHQDVIDK